MEAPSPVELREVESASTGAQPSVSVHWQSRFGLIVIEVRQGRAYVNGDLVEPVPSAKNEPGAAEQ